VGPDQATPRANLGVIGLTANSNICSKDSPRSRQGQGADLSGLTYGLAIKYWNT